jgi:hypothetical protein
VLLLTGCDDKARQLAKEAQAALAEYRTELNRQADIERKAYRSQTVVESQANWDQAISELDQEKIERARNFAADAIAGRWPIERWRSALREYAEMDMKIRRTAIASESDRQLQLTARLASLQLSKQRLDLLDKVLTELAEKPKLVDQLTSAADFGKSVATEFDKNACAALKSELADKTKALDKAKLEVTAAGAGPQDKIDEATAARKKADAAVAQINLKRMDKDCDAVEKKK